MCSFFIWSNEGKMPTMWQAFKGWSQCSYTDVEVLIYYLQERTKLFVVVFWFAMRRRFGSKVLPHLRSNPSDVEFIMKESNRTSWNLIWMWIKVSHIVLDKDYPFTPPPLLFFPPLNVTWVRAPKVHEFCRIVRWLWWINYQHLMLGAP